MFLLTNRRLGVILQTADKADSFLTYSFKEAGAREEYQLFLLQQLMSGTEPLFTFSMAKLPVFNFCIKTSRTHKKNEAACICQ